MNVMQTTEVRVAVLGRVPAKLRQMAAAKVEAVLRNAPEPVLAAHVTLTVAADPAVPCPAVAQVTVDLNGQIVRAQAAQRTMRAAIHQLADRLKVRLDRSARNWAALRGTLPSPEPREGEWRHQSIPAHRDSYFPRPIADRAVIRRPSYAPGPLTPDEAAAELDLLDYDFHLFTERSTGQASVIYRDGDRYRLDQVLPKRDRLGPLPGTVTLSDSRAPRLGLTDAIDCMELPRRAFLFFVQAQSGRAGVLYHRYDGHYGLVELDGG